MKNKFKLLILLFTILLTSCHYTFCDECGVVTSVTDDWFISSGIGKKYRIEIRTCNGQYAAFNSDKYYFLSDYVFKVGDTIKFIKP